MNPQLLNNYDFNYHKITQQAPSTHHNPPPTKSPPLPTQLPPADFQEASKKLQPLTTSMITYCNQMCTYPLTFSLDILQRLDHFSKLPQASPKTLVRLVSYVAKLRWYLDV